MEPPKIITTPVATLHECVRCGRDTFNPVMCGQCVMEEYGEPEDERRYHTDDELAIDAGVKPWGPL